MEANKYKFISLFISLVCFVSCSGQKNIWKSERLYSNRFFLDSVYITSDYDFFIAQSDTLEITNDSKLLTKYNPDFSYWVWDKYKQGFSLTFRYNKNRNAVLGLNFFAWLDIKNVKIKGEQYIKIKYFNDVENKKNYKLYFFKLINITGNKFNTVHYYKKVQHHQSPN